MIVDQSRRRFRLEFEKAKTSATLHFSHPLSGCPVEKAYIDVQNTRLSKSGAFRYSDASERVIFPRIFSCSISFSVLYVRLNSSARV